ncbi:hypothetical protein PanWU01x14_210030 [Parasponia andersonii]|uniref:Uncharacterized protein n=1 Tax=Parasponia andersonii TaxID=3476 RepID=A0A2P5BU34_PARAD|nr:hypothetical protein PanWU01x14_210030 [Parasponia andersonii]
MNPNVHWYSCCVNHCNWQTLLIQLKAQGRFPRDPTPNGVGLGGLFGDEPEIRYDTYPSRSRGGDSPPHLDPIRDFPLRLCRVFPGIGVRVRTGDGDEIWGREGDGEGISQPRSARFMSLVITSNLNKQGQNFPSSVGSELEAEMKSGVE